MFLFSYSSWFVLFHFSVTLWDNDTFIWIYSKRETAKKKKRLSFKTMAMRAYKFRQETIPHSLLVSLNIIKHDVICLHRYDIHSMQIILHFTDFAGDKSIAFDSSVFLASLLLISNFEYYTTVLLLFSKLKDVSPTNTPQVLGIHSTDWQKIDIYDRGIYQVSISFTNRQSGLDTN